MSFKQSLVSGFYNGKKIEILSDGTVMEGNYVLNGAGWEFQYSQSKTLSSTIESGYNGSWGFIIRLFENNEFVQRVDAQKGK